MIIANILVAPFPALVASVLFFELGGTHRLGRCRGSDAARRTRGLSGPRACPAGHRVRKVIAVD